MKPADVIPLTRTLRPSGPGVGPDLLMGAGEIAAFVFGDAGQARRVYRLRAKGRLPVFKIGGRICARRSALRNWLADQEQSAMAGR